MTDKEEITQLKNTEQEFQEAKERNERAPQAKSHFLANIIHELRTPLSTIINYKYMLEKLVQKEGLK